MHGYQLKKYFYFDFVWRLAVNYLSLALMLQPKDQCERE